MYDCHTCIGYPFVASILRQQWQQGQSEFLTTKAAEMAIKVDVTTTKTTIKPTTTTTTTTQNPIKIGS